MKSSRPVLIIAIACLLAAAAGAGVVALLLNIRQKQEQGRLYPLMLAKLSDDDVRPGEWGKNFPSEWAGFQRMSETDKPTMYGGNFPYSRLIRYPQLLSLWAGYPFAKDFNEERGHFYSQIDQMETKRNNAQWLREHGFPKFTGQPGACMNCHSGWAPGLIREVGWLKFNSTPYQELSEKLKKDHGEGIHGQKLGGTCADCHSPDDMSLRVTRPAYINAMVARGYDSDPKQGIRASRQEMRSHVCQQCHVEYYFQPQTKELTFPWANWPKDEPLHIEMIEAYYDAVRQNPEGFQQDFIHGETGAKILKVQHPEAELFSSGVHARSKVACADCHMPYQREGALKVTNHKISSPLFNINGSCQTCHPGAEGNLMQKVQLIQNSTANALRETEGAIMALIDDLRQARTQLVESDRFKGKSEQEGEAYLQSVLGDAREFHRRASLRWDFVFSENSTGFHSPQESLRVLSQAIDFARRGQLALQAAMTKEGRVLIPNSGQGKPPPQPGVIPSDEVGRVVGLEPPQWMIDLDKKVAAGL